MRVEMRSNNIHEVPYRERITGKSLEIFSKSTNGHNRIKMFMEPLDEVTMKLIREGEIKTEQDPKDRAKIMHDKAGWDPKEARRIWEIYNESVLIDGTHGIQRLERIKSYCCGAFRNWLNAGNLCKEPVVGVKVTFFDATVHVDPAHTGFNEIASMMFSSLSLCFFSAKPHLFEVVREPGDKQIIRYQLVPEHEEEVVISKIRHMKGLDHNMVPTDELLGFYQGTQLVQSNASVMEELEWILVKPIPLYPAIESGWFPVRSFSANPDFEINRESFGFTVRNKWIFTLSLYGQGIAALPAALDHLYNLENLILDYNHLDELPDSIIKLPWLQVLTLHSNWLIALPQDFGKLQSLKYLDLSDNRLEVLPHSVGELSHLEVLNLSHNPLLTLPPELSRLSSLATLYIDEKFGDDPMIKKIGKKTRVYAGTKADVEKIKNINQVQGQLVGIKMREERMEAARNAKIQASKPPPRVVTTVDDIPPEERF